MPKISILKDLSKIGSLELDITMLIGCVIISAMTCYSHIKGSTFFILASLLLFLIFCVYACIKNTAFAVLLFFLPWSPLLKLYTGGLSFFTFALLITCLLYLCKNKFNLDIYQVILSGFIIALTLVAKAVQGNSIENSYLFFIVMLLLFPSIIKNSHFSINLWVITVFFACGIITAAISAQQVANYPNIAQYIKVDSYLTITRLSGYYRDPNFYSAHITACLAGIQIILCRENKRLRQIILAVISVALIYCGLLSASKAFILVSACLVLVWMPALLERGNQTGKIRVVIGILCAGIIILSSSAFQELFKIIDDRFAYAANVSELTTGRTELWRRYLFELTHNLPLALIGEGYTNVILNGRASHNTIIQGIYQFGLIGFPLLCIWMYRTLKTVFSKSKLMKKNKKYIILMSVGVVLPWMSLDILFFDEFFLLSVYAAIGSLYAVSDNLCISESAKCQ